MILELLVAATIGVSFANTWMCVLLSFGAATEGMDASRSFIAGRFVGVVAIGMAIASMRLALQDHMGYVFLAFGILSIGFAVLIISRQFLERRVLRNRAEKGCSTCSHCDHEEGDEDGAKSLFWSSCSCGLFSPLGSSCDHGTHEGCGSWSPKGRRFSSRYGLALGLFRGATPCAKILLLAPLLIVSELPMAFLLIVVYAATSTVYPVIGLLSARLIWRIKGHAMAIRAAGAVVILVIGIYSIVKFLLWDPNAPCLQ